MVDTREYCYHLMDGECRHKNCWFRHDLPVKGSIEFEKAMVRKQKFQSRKNRRKPIIYVDMDGVLVDFNSGVAQLPDDLRKEYEPDFDYVPGIFATMDPMPGAIDACKILFAKYEVYFLSAPSRKNPSCYTDKHNWIAFHVGENYAQYMILSRHKHLQRGDYLIDDRPVPNFKGKQLLFGSPEFPDWNAVLNFFNTKKL